MSQENYFFDDEQEVQHDSASEPHPQDGNEVVLSRDELLHGGDDDRIEALPAVVNTRVVESDTPTPETPVAAPRNVLNQLKFAFVSALGRNKANITVRNAFGVEVTREVKSKDVITKAAERYSRMKMAESPQKLEGPWYKKMADRMWRGTFTEGIHKVKEKYHGLKLMEAAGVETGITAEFDAEIDRQARERLEAKRSREGSQLSGKIKDFFQELIGHERDLHKEKVAVTTEMRAKFDTDPSDANNPLFHLVNRDVASREALAQNVMNSDIDFLHAGDKKTGSIKIEKDSAIDKFLKTRILLRVKDDVISQAERGKYSGRISDKLRNELDKELQDYFFTDEFAAWRDGLTPEQKSKFENSFTYGQNILRQTEEAFVPVVEESLDHIKSLQVADLSIEIVLGTAQIGPVGEVQVPSRFEKERLSLNQALFDKIRTRMRAKRGVDAVYGESDMKRNLKWEHNMAVLNAAAGSEFFAAFAGAGIGRLALTGARAGMSLIPVLGSGLAAGGFSAIKEYYRTTDIRGDWLTQKAEGYEHPAGANAARAEAMRRVDYHRIDLGHRIQQLAGMVEILGGTDTPTDAQLLQTIGYLADSKARINLGDKRGYSLFSATSNGPEGRGNFSDQEEVHNNARALAITKLMGLLDGAEHADLRNRLANTIGVDPSTVTDSHSLIAILARGQEHHLKTGTTLNAGFQAVMGRDLKLMIQEEQSIDSRDRAFNHHRWGRTAKYGAASGVAAATLTAAFGLGEQQVETLMDRFDFTIDQPTTVTLLPANNHIHLAELPDSAVGVEDSISQTAPIPPYTHIPNGTHWEIDPGLQAQGDMSKFDLVLDKYPGYVLINNAEFKPDGTLIETDSILADLARNNLRTSYIEHVLPGQEAVGEIDTSQWTNTLTYEEMGGSPDQFFANHVNEIMSEHPEYSTGTDTLPEVDRSSYINAMRYIWRSKEVHYFDPEHPNVHVNQIEGFPRDVHFDNASLLSKETGVKEFLTEAQADNVEITGIPDVIYSTEGNEKIMQLVQESIQQHDSGQPFSDEAHRIAYEISKIGTEDKIPDKQELDILFKYLGESQSAPSTPESVVRNLVIQNDVLTTTVTVPQTVPVNVPGPIPFVSPGYYKPLEAPIGRDRSIRPIPVPPPEQGEEPPFEMGYGYGLPEIQITDQSLSPYDTTALTVGENQSKTIEDYYHARMMPQLVADKYFKPTFKESTDWYFAKQNEKYMEALKVLNSQVKPMNENVKEVICIPVAAGQEGDNIYKTLQKYSSQVDREGGKINTQWEVVLFLNRPENIQEDHTAREIERFVKDNPDVNIVPVYGVFEPGKVKYGAFIKYAYDLAMFRARNRRVNGDKDIIIASGDADLEDMSPTYIADTIEYFKSNPTKEAGLAKQDMDPKILAEFPTFYATVRFQQFVEAQARGSSFTENRRHIQTQGRTTLMRASTMSALGGVNSYTGAGADTELGKMLLLARTGKLESAPGPETPFEYLNAAEIRTNPRRELINILMGGTYTETWDKFNSNMENDNVRKMSMKNLIAQYGSSIIDVKEFERQINSFRNWNVFMDGKHVERALGFLGLRKGVDYSIVGAGKDASITLTSECKPLQDMFNRFKAENT